MDKASKMAFIALVLSGVSFFFLLGMIFGTPLLRWWHEAGLRQEQAPAALPSWEDEIRLLDEAVIYVLFWERRVPRLQKAAARFGWNQLELAKAFRLIEAIKPQFQAVEIGYFGWGTNPEVTYDLLKKEVDELYGRLELICEEFGLICQRGIPPDQAHFKPGQPSKPSRKFWRAFFSQICL